MNAANLSPGSIFDNKYEIKSVLGSGAAGTVYRAYEINLDRDVAIKVLNIWSASENRSSLLLRFRREAKSLTSLNHPGILKVYKFGMDEIPFLVSEFFEAQSLREVLQKEGSFTFGLARKVLVKLASALSYAHSMSIIHRDLKPENILLDLSDRDDPKLKIIDFGLCKEEGRVSSSQALTITGDLVGTASYMSPEQVKGLPVDKRSDVYSFGCIMHELFTGEIYFKGESVPQLLLKQINEPLPRLLDINPKSSLPAEFDELIQDCSKKNPELRPSSFEEIVRRLEAIEIADTNAKFLLPQAKTSQLGAGFYKYILPSTLCLLLIALIYYASNFLLAPEQSKAASNAALQSLLSSGNAEAARNFAQQSTQSQAFANWPAVQKEDLLFSYFQSFDKYRDHESAFKYLLYYLKIAVETHTRATSQDKEWQDRIVLIRDFLLNGKSQSRSHWKQLEPVLTQSVHLKNKYHIDQRSSIFLSELCEESKFRPWQSPPPGVCLEYCKGNMGLVRDAVLSRLEKQLCELYRIRALETARKYGCKAQEAFILAITCLYHLNNNKLEEARLAMENCQAILEKLEHSAEDKELKFSLRAETHKIQESLYNRLLANAESDQQKSIYKRELEKLKVKSKALSEARLEDRALRDEAFVELFK